MKNFLNYLTFALFASLIVFASCDGGGSDPDPEDSALDLALANLVGTATWESFTTSPSGVSDLEWSAFTITFTGTTEGGTYTVAGAPEDVSEVWPNGQSTWTFNGDTGTSITRGDGTVIGITASETTLRMDFTYASTAARINEIEGSWVMNLTYDVAQ